MLTILCFKRFTKATFLKKKLFLKSVFFDRLLFIILIFISMFQIYMRLQTLLIVSHKFTLVTFETFNECIPSVTFFIFLNFIPMFQNHVRLQTNASHKFTFITFDSIHSITFSFSFLCSQFTCACTICSASATNSHPSHLKVFPISLCSTTIIPGLG